MTYPALRAKLHDFYDHHINDRARDFCARAYAQIEAAYREGMTVFAQKRLQHQVIADLCDPVLFEESPFYYELGTMSAHCDGARWFRGDHAHAGGWTYQHNEHLFREQDAELYRLRRAQGNALFYLICGEYNDSNQHFNFNHRPILQKGFRGVYEEAQTALSQTTDEKERDFLQSVCNAALCVKRILEKFAQKAKKMQENAASDAVKARMARIADSAAHAPWEAPRNFYEALNCYAFCRKVVGALEGVGVNTFGRLDLDLYPFYVRDIADGILTKEEAYALLCQFLITFDCHYDHDMKMVGYADHELENTYVLGGCDREGKPVYNEITELCLRATREEKIIFPKIKCRFSKDSPKAYLDEINRAVLAGTSAILYQNDDATIPALLATGRTLIEARDYIVSGCWGVMCTCEKPDNGMYVNILKPLEYSIHQIPNTKETLGMEFLPIDEAKDFETVYRITLRNIQTLFAERARIGRLGANVWDRVDPLPLFSSTFEDCIQNKKDFTSGGARYRDDQYLCFGLPNVVDSLLAIRQLCFEEKKYTLPQFLCAVRNNWQDCEDMRLDATHCHGWGDGSKISCDFANRLNDDLFAILQSLEGCYGGKIHMGHLTYTEIRFWAEKTLATPDGRHHGTYLAQGLTPSRLKKISSVTDVIRSLAALDPKKMGGNTVVNLILPSDRMNLDLLEGFLRACAQSAMQSLQLNCVTKEELLDAQIHPEAHEDLIVRVTGFSAKFISLSAEWQKEFLTRNFYD